jgi:uncharacterized protein
MKEIINAQLKEAMKAKDELKLTTLRSILTALTNAEKNVEKKTEPVEVLKSMIKQRKSSAEIYMQQNEKLLADREEAEISIIESFLPKQMSDDEAISALKEIISEVGAKDAKDLGKVIKGFNAKHVGLYDNKKLSEKIRELLA